MKNIVKLALGALIVVSASGCAMVTGGDASATGFLYSGYKSSGAVGTAQAAKTGQACASTILGLIATGDASVTAAKQAGGITQVAHVDHEIFDVLGIYGTTCTIVSGQ